MADTIVALATPTGRSGIGVVRLSGDVVLDIARRMMPESATAIKPRHSHFTSISDPETSELIDDSVITFFQGPASFTGEDVIEFACHGSPVILRQVIDVCLRLGARMAEPGEFSLRALANGKMDLAEVEAVRDLINARTTASVRQAVRQMRGEMSHQLQPIKDELLDIIVVLESALEFVEDDLPDSNIDDISERLNAIQQQMESLAATFKTGRLLREGLKVALIGPPNVGKSSLFNALLGSERAIVTEIAGTTRDQLHEQLTIDDIPISLIDTAGLRHTDDVVESLGVERSRRVMADADVVIALMDITDKNLTVKGFEELEGANVIYLLNKTDLVDRETAESAARAISEETLQTPLLVSAKTGQGLDDLKRAVKEPFVSDDAPFSGWMISDARHHDLIRRSVEEVESSIALLKQRSSEEITLLGLHNALRLLGEITGETTTEDMLTRIFSTFCIGK
ncbi:MAG: tRNA uridine-5-carboxymethylaminomethyl(34) synthesis GTPase MnmE [Acidobacteria bacterium]|nr:tRNA uridine-5-carboxymethylaminomethyl(34) synthesis GTPase MnmE [Acidobacteriota bacterium]